MSDSPWPPQVLDIARKVHALGGRALLVGGCVRDHLLGRPSVEWDVEVYALPAAELETLLRRSYRVRDIGRSYGVLKLDEVEVDVSLPRRETKSARGHKGFDVDADPWLDLRSAAERRDLTVNAMYLDPLTGVIEDPLGGEQDLRAGVLRHCSERFAEDPLRVLRVMQFAARLQFPAHPDTVELCRRLDLRELPAERIAAEWRKLFLRGQRPSMGLQFLVRCGATRFFPLLDAASDPQHETAGRALDAFVPGRPADEEAAVAGGLALLVRALGGDRGPREEELEWASGRRSTRRTALVLAGKADRVLAWDSGGREDAAVRRSALDLAVRDFLAVARAWENAAGRSDEAVRDFEAAARRLGVLEQPLQPWLSGRDLIERGAATGPGLGALLEAALEAQIEGRIADRAAALDWAERALREAGD